MKKCVLCENYFSYPLTFLELISFKSINNLCLCTNCQQKFSRLTGNCCQQCNRELKGQNICADCLAWQDIYGKSTLKNQALYKYNAAFHDLMVNYKRYGDYCLRKVLQTLIVSRVKKLNYDYYVPIPTSPEHRKKRQFDTISEIFKDLVVLTPILDKKSGSGAQGEKNRAERLAAPQAFFVAKDFDFKDNISNERFLLLDDIYTTGKTLYNARDKLLEEFPNARIESFSICR